MKTQHASILRAIICFLSCAIVSVSTIVQAQPLDTSAPPFMPPATGSPPQAFSAQGAQDMEAFLKKIETQDFAVSLQAWLDAGRVDHDLNKQMLIRLRLASAMRKRMPPPEFYSQIKTFIADSSNSDFEREQMIALLGESATKESTDLLIEESTALKAKNLKDKAVGAIGGLRSSDENLAPALEKLWLQSKDQQLIASTALSMAHIGAPSSINLLLSSALAPAGRDDFRKRIAQGALTTVFVKDAVPPLAAALAKQPPTSPQAILAFTTLTQIPDTTAAQAIIAWLQTADDSAAPLALRWVTRGQHESSSKAAATALDPKIPFASEQVREALRAGLEAHQNNSSNNVIRDNGRRQ